MYLLTRVIIGKQVFLDTSHLIAIEILRIYVYFNLFESFFTTRHIVNLFFSHFFYDLLHVQCTVNIPRNFEEFFF